MDAVAGPLIVVNFLSVPEARWFLQGTPWLVLLRTTSFRVELGRALVVALVAAVVVVFHYDLWKLSEWQFPVDYHGDAPEVLAQIRAAAEGGMNPLQPKVIGRLGAPFGASWNAYPTPDKPLLWLLGGLSRLVGLFPAANFAVVLVQVMAALSFYASARWLRCRWSLAAAGALLFAFSYHTFHRGLGHLSIIHTWLVPLALLSVALVSGSRRLSWRSGGAWFCLATAAALGWGNPYYLFFWGQLTGWGLLLQFFLLRRPANVQVGLAALGVGAVSFVAANVELWWHVQEAAASPLLARNYGGTEMYALKPMELLVPPASHRWGALAEVGERYLRWSDWRGEVFPTYLGVVGILSLLAMAMLTVRRLVRRQGLPGTTLAAGWLVVYSALGGITNLLALFFGFQIFRATNRVAIFLSAMLLLFAVVRLSRWSASRHRLWSPFLALLLAVVGLADQLPRPASEGARALRRASVESDVRMAAELERRLPDGAMLFQLPVLGFPEVAGVHDLRDYEQFRLFLVSGHLRFTYGATKNRARSRWQRDVEALPAERLVARLERYGFAALAVSRRGYGDRGEGLLSELRRLGYAEQLESGDGQRVVVPLRPVSRPKLPLARSLSPGKGWHPRGPDGVRWAHGGAYVSFFNPAARPIQADVSLELVSAVPREVTVELEGRVMARKVVGMDPVVLSMRGLRLPPGVSDFRLDSLPGAVRTGSGRYQLRSFGLRDARVSAGGDGLPGD